MKDAFDKDGMDARIDPKAVAVSAVARAIKAGMYCPVGAGAAVAVALAAVRIFKLLTRDR